MDGDLFKAFQTLKYQIRKKIVRSGFWDERNKRIAGYGEEPESKLNGWQGLKVQFLKYGCQLLRSNSRNIAALLSWRNVR